MEEKSILKNKEAVSKVVIANKMKQSKIIHQLMFSRLLRSYLPRNDDSTTFDTASLFFCNKRKVATKVISSQSY